MNFKYLHLPIMVLWWVVIVAQNSLKFTAHEEGTF